jgi:cupin fold WbuC family metalloprotein
MINKKIRIPELSSVEIVNNFEKAEKSNRRRHPKILHKPGADFNQVFNFMKEDSYMQPHLHPGDEKIEKMYLIKGKFAVIFFDNKGKIKSSVLLEKGNKEEIEIPAFVWHTYVMLSNEVICYETMMGKYEPETWKNTAKWAPPENTPKSLTYLYFLKAQVT